MVARLDDSSLGAVAQFLAALNCGAMLVDRQGVILHANDPLAAMMHRPAISLVGSNIHRLLKNDASRGDAERLLDAVSEQSETELVLPLPDGKQLPVIASARPASTTPPWSEFRIITLMNIAAQKKAEENVRNQYHLVTEMSDTLLQQALELKRYSQTLEQRVQDRTAELHEAHMDAIYMLAIASEAKDADTGRHVRRIAGLARDVATQLGYGEEEAEAIGYSAILHDVGKIHVPDNILGKPGPLDERERARMQLHTLAGERILSTNAFFERARRIARSHHEEFDGSGYPDGIAGDAIPIEARIVHLVDVFDALTHSRAYKEAWPFARAMDEILLRPGRFDPEVIKAFNATLPKSRDVITAV